MTRTVVVYRSNRIQPAAWFTRCTEFDEHGTSIRDRTAMDVQLNARSFREAQREAAEFWGCSPNDVKELGK
jgi:hypothetical protein